MRILWFTLFITALLIGVSASVAMVSPTNNTGFVIAGFTSMENNSVTIPLLKPKITVADTNVSVSSGNGELKNLNISVPWNYIDQKKGDATAIFTAKMMTDIEKNADNLHHMSTCNTSVPIGWSIYPCDPLEILPAFPNITFRSGYKIVGYYCNKQRDRYGKFFVLSSSQTLEEVKNKSSEPVLPSGADEQFMSYISGDGTPVSYIQASIFLQAIHNTGFQIYHNDPQSYFDETKVERERIDQSLSHTSDRNVSRIYGFNIESFSWSEKAAVPEFFDPKVTKSDENVTVEYYTCASMGMKKIYRNTDVYTGSYAPVSKRDLIGTGGIGWVS